MARPAHVTLTQRVARAICAKTNIARLGELDVILDNPDDLVWEDSQSPPRPLPRWRLYEERARAALETIRIEDVREALHAILRQVKRGRSPVPIVIERSFNEIEELAQRALEHLD